MRKATLFASGLLEGPPFLGLHDYKLFPTTLISTHLWVLLTSDLSLFQKKTGKLTRQIIHPYH